MEPMPSVEHIPVFPMPTVEHIPVFNQQSLNTQFNHQNQKMSAFNMDLNSSNLNLLERVKPPVLHLLPNNTTNLLTNNNTEQ